MILLPLPSPQNCGYGRTFSHAQFSVWVLSYELGSSRLLPNTLTLWISSGATFLSLFVKKNGTRGCLKTIRMPFLPLAVAYTISVCNTTLHLRSGVHTACFHGTEWIKPVYSSTYPSFMSPFNHLCTHSVLWRGKHWSGSSEKWAPTSLFLVNSWASPRWVVVWGLCSLSHRLIASWEFGWSPPLLIQSCLEKQVLIPSTRKRPCELDPNGTPCMKCLVYRRCSTKVEKVAKEMYSLLFVAVMDKKPLLGKMV